MSALAIRFSIFYLYFFFIFCDPFPLTQCLLTNRIISLGKSYQTTLVILLHNNSIAAYACMCALCREMTKELRKFVLSLDIQSTYMRVTRDNVKKYARLQRIDSGQNTKKTNLVAGLSGFSAMPFPVCSTHCVYVHTHLYRHKKNVYEKKISPHRNSKINGFRHLTVDSYLERICTT